MTHTTLSAFHLHQHGTWIDQQNLKQVLFFFIVRRPHFHTMEQMTWIRILIAFIIFLGPPASCFQPFHLASRRKHGFKADTLTRLLSQDTPQDEIVEEEEDWRAFRARLVRNEGSISGSNLDSDSSWVINTGSLVEKGSIVISRVESSLGCHDLRQPYFCKCVILIVDHDEDFTQGIILNRPSNLDLNDQDIMYVDDEGNPLIDETIDHDDDDTNDKSDSTIDPNGNSWRMFFGGDIADLYDANPMITCLHNLTSEEAESISDPLLPNLFLTSHLGAKALVEAGEATPNSFFTFYGFCGWESGQLEREIERGSWYLISSDSQLLWNELDALRNPTNDPRSVGLDMWKGIMNKLDRGDNPTGDDDFPTLMLKEWATEFLMLSRTNVDGDTSSCSMMGSGIQDADIFQALNALNPSDEHLRPGSLLRASSKTPSPFLLQDQFLHKSTLLILEETDNFAAGAVLNLPTSDQYGLQTKDGTIVSFTVRYGGPGNMEDDSANPLLWLHQNPTLKQVGLGKPLGSHEGVWMCQVDEVIEALDARLVNPSDILVVQGFCVWEKTADGGGGIRGQLRSGNFQSLENDRANKAWPMLLSQQEVLSKESLKSNLERAFDLWQFTGSEEDSGGKSNDKSRLVFGTNKSVANLADDALTAWVQIFLLGNSEYYV